MSEPPTAPLSERARLTAVVLGGVIGIVLVLHWVADMGPMEIALVLLPFLVFAAPALAFYVWARRRGDLP